jgi:GTP-binding protein HflX
VSAGETTIDGLRRGDRALVLKPIMKSPLLQRDASAMLEEAVGLARAIDLAVVHASVVSLSRAIPATLLGKGIVEQYRDIIAEQKIDLAVIDHALMPVQQRNLEKEWSCKVIDRTGLILEIFGARARTREGQLQVELAALNYQKSRLVRSWTHLERQRGGFGFLGGPGESQLEMDRRLIGQRVIKLKDELGQVRRTRGLQREARQRAEHPTIALVGYTNAGKSSLFNKLTGADVLAKDMLFATLDPAMRGFQLPSGRKAILSDTVGFISDLPTHLVEAFRATLEEVQQADLILHVRDVTHPETKSQRDAVIDILAELGIDEADTRLIEVLNKIDQLPEDERAHIRNYARRTTWEVGQAQPLDGLRPEAQGGMVAISALTGDGVEDLLKLLDDRLSSRGQAYDISLSPTEGAALSWLYAHGKVVDKRDGKTKIRLKVELGAADYGRFQSRFGKKL